ncbi:hypothetical protein ACLQ24_21705 [Micromonospora sp. DT4]|uniref:hypothetical protein n=1 Tax=Micromonospora sp. DT4 TaxID=3393438 RepID=UPI003CF8321A
MLLITATQGDATFEQYAIEAMLDRQVDGVIYAAMATRRLTVPPAIRGGSVVLLDATSSDGLPCVLPDDDRAGRAVAIGFLDHVDGAFIGALSDPVPVRYHPSTGPILHPAEADAAN